MLLKKISVTFFAHFNSISKSTTLIFNKLKTWSRFYFELGNTTESDKFYIVQFRAPKKSTGRKSLSNAHLFTKY